MADLNLLSECCSGDVPRHVMLNFARLADQGDATWGSPVAYVTTWLAMLRQREHVEYRDALDERLTTAFMTNFALEIA